MQRLVLGWLNCPDVAATDLVDVAADAGFDAVGLRITGRTRTDPYPSILGNAAAIRHIRARAGARGVAIHNVSIQHLYPDVALPDLESALDTAAAIGAGLVLASGYDFDRMRLTGRMIALAEAAAQRALRVFIEFVPFSEVKSLADAMAIVRDVDRINFGMTIDPLHLARSGGLPADLRAVPADRLFFLQLCDAAPTRPEGIELAAEARTMRREPGDGALPLHGLLDAAPADIDLECEYPTSRNLKLAPRERAVAIRAAALRFLERHAAVRASTV